MLENGFIEEVELLKMRYPELTQNHPSMRTTGYQQIWQYLDGQINRQELENQGIAATRQLAKRQITWLRSILHQQQQKQANYLAINNLDQNTAYTNIAKILDAITRMW